MLFIILLYLYLKDLFSGNGYNPVPPQICNTPIDSRLVIDKALPLYAKESYIISYQHFCYQLPNNHRTYMIWHIHDHDYKKSYTGVLYICEGPLVACPTVHL